MDDFWAFNLIRDLYQGSLGRVIEEIYMMNRALGAGVVVALGGAIFTGLKVIVSNKTNGSGPSVEE